MSNPIMNLILEGLHEQTQLEGEIKTLRNKYLYVYRDYHIVSLYGGKWGISDKLNYTLKIGKSFSTKEEAAAFIDKNWDKMSKFKRADSDF